MAIVLGAVGCARVTGGAPGSGGIEHPSGPNQLVLRVETGGGFVPSEYTLTQTAGFSLYGDGTVVTTGPQIEIYPGPALPNVQEQTVTDAGIRAILDAAREAGLHESNDYIEPQTISDAPTTIFTLVEGDGTRHITKAYALTESNDDGLPQKDREARQRLRRFADRLGSLRDWLPAGSVSEEREYTMQGLRIFVREYGPNEAEPSLTQPDKDWPLSQPLGTFGQPVEGQAGLRCGVVTGPDLQTLLPEVRRSNELTPWRSEGTRYRLFLRPLLPDESGC